MTELQAQQNERLRRTAVGIAGVSILVSVLGCGRDTTVPVSAQTQPPRAVSVASVPQEEKRSPAVYQSRGRRDPFRPPHAVTPETLPTVRLTLTGIVREARAYYALVESESSPGTGYIIHENDVVDSAKVVKITKDSVVFAVQMKNRDGKLLTRYVEKRMLPVVPR